MNVFCSKSKTNSSYGPQSRYQSVLVLIVYIERQTLRRRKNYKIKNIGENVRVLILLIFLSCGGSIIKFKGETRC